MNNKSFTLVEILVALIIMTTLASLSLATYEKTLQETNDRICAQRNLRLINEALSLYYLEKSTLPLTLSQLTPEQIHLAYVKVMGQSQKENRLFTFFRNIFCLKPALALSREPLPRKYYGGNPNILKCPADRSADTVSYAYDPNRVIDKATGKLIKDSPYAIVYDRSAYHKKGILSPTLHANGITPGGIIGEIDDEKKVKK